jgi:thioredoxin-related protein
MNSDIINQFLILEKGKQMRTKTAVMMVLFCLLTMGSGIGETIDWKKFSEGARLAKKENKKVFLHFRTDWCGYCLKMEETTFKNDSVVRFLNEHFISIKVDGDRQVPIVKEYKVAGFPDNRFLDEQMNAAYRLPGFIEPATFSFFLEYIQTGHYKTMDPMQYYKTR